MADTSSRDAVSRRRMLPPGTILPAIGAILLVGFITMAVCAAWLAPYDPSLPDFRARLTPPAWQGNGSARHLLGTDHLGRDILSRLIYGSRVALIVGFSGVLLAMAIGVMVGLVAGYAQGRLDRMLMSVVDILIAIPNTLLYLTILALFGQSLWLLVLAIGCVNWTTFARVVRGETLSLAKREFVQASVTYGQRPIGIILKHILPNVAGPIIVIATLNVGALIILEASLSFLGFGVQPPTVTWGRMLADGRNYVATAWWLATFPGLTITLLVLSLIFVGDWLRDRLDPRRSE